MQGPFITCPSEAQRDLERRGPLIDPDSMNVECLALNGSCTGWFSSGSGLALRRTRVHRRDLASVGLRRPWTLP